MASGISTSLFHDSRFGISHPASCQHLEKPMWHLILQPAVSACNAGYLCWWSLGYNVF